MKSYSTCAALFMSTSTCNSRWCRPHHTFSQSHNVIAVIHSSSASSFVIIHRCCLASHRLPPLFRFPSPIVEGSRLPPHHPANIALYQHRALQQVLYKNGSAAPPFSTSGRTADMVTLVGVGVLLISAGPSIGIWLGILQRRAHLLVIAIIAAFTWCLSLMLSGAIWFAIPPLKQKFPWVLFVTVTFQELFRFLLYYSFRLLARNGDGVEAFLRHGAKNNIMTGLSVGVGFGLMSVLVNFYSVLADEFWDDTALYTTNCEINFFVAASGFALAFSVLHILLGILAWPAYSDERGWDKILIAYVAHLGIAEATLFNRRTQGCKWNLGLVWGLVACLTVFVSFLSSRRIKMES